MAILQFSVDVRNNRLNALEGVIGAGAVLYLRSGPPPPSCSSFTDTGALLCTIPLPEDFMNTAGGGVKTLKGSWVGTGAATAGTGIPAGYFRIKKANTTHCQGDVTATGGGGAMTLANVLIAAGQPVQVTTFTLTDGNA